jgi:RNA recognition motif-containing protein
MVKIYVGNLSWGTDEEGLRSAFAAFGEVASASVALDRQTGRSRGFGFVEMPSREDAELAIREMNGRDLDGRRVRVNESRPKPNGQGRQNRRGGFKGGFRGDHGGRRNNDQGRGRHDWERGRW